MGDVSTGRAIRVGENALGLDVEAIRADFPILDQKINDKPLIYLDNAATSQKPRTVINALIDYYRKYNANIHRGVHALAEQATERYEATRSHVARFLGDIDRERVVFTKGTTEAINLIASSYGVEQVRAGDNVVVTEMEHHANFVPWFHLADSTGAELRRIPITVCGHLDLSRIDDIITDRTRIVAVSHMSNVLGTIVDLQPLIDRAHDVGAIVVIDGAQSVPHFPVDLSALDADFYVFSAHKMLGPTGVGVLVGQREILDAMPPYQYGGSMIQEVRFDRVTYESSPNRFEAGTPNIADVVAFDAALSYLEHLGMDAVRLHERELTRYALRKLQEVPGLELQGPADAEHRGGVFSFTDPDIHPADIGAYLDAKGIAIRAGHHCAQPLLRQMQKVATARASIYVYNDESDIDRLVAALVDMRTYFGVG